MPSPFIWYELLTPDIEGAAKFYSDVVGWTVQPSGQPDMDYRFWKAGETPIGGLMATTEPAMRPGWIGYVRVPDVDATVTQITDLGGAVLMPAMTLPEVGRMAMVADPQGAAIYVMTPQGDMPAAANALGQPGHAGWNELHTTDWQAALRFYGETLGWGAAEAMDMGPMGTYQLFHDGDAPIGGMMNSPNFPRPAWLYYFNITGIDAAKARVEAAGGTVLMGPHEVPGGQWVLQARDPQGVMFALLGQKD
ncbi:MAG: VOC family protein [Pseudomonadota bacterium]